MSVKSFLIACVFTSLSALAFALDLELTQGINSMMPIGVEAIGDDALVQQMAEVLSNDLNISGQFKVVTLPRYTEGSISAWRRAGADHVVSAVVNKAGFNRYEAEVKVLDSVATQGKVLFKRSYSFTSGQWRALTHHVSDEIYQVLTGERGVFSTRIAYILAQRHGAQAKYFLEIADMDGFNPQRLLVSTDPLMSPAWSPDGRQIAYVSFEKKKAQIFTIDVATGRRRLITSFAGINGAPAWSADGHELAVVLSKEGTPKIYTINLSNGHMQQVTFGTAIDTEPRYAPNGRSLLFTSGRGGTPQIYRLSFNDGQIMRLTFEGNYNARASYSPDEKHLIMLHRDDKNFSIAAQDTNGKLTQLTFSSMDESPSVAPNGRLIVYATHHNEQGILGIVSVDGRLNVHLPHREGDIQDPTWSPFIG